MHDTQRSTASSSNVFSWIHKNTKVHQDLNKDIASTITKIESSIKIQKQKNKTFLMAKGIPDHLRTEPTSTIEYELTQKFNPIKIQKNDFTKTSEEFFPFNAANPKPTNCSANLNQKHIKTTPNFFPEADSNNLRCVTTSNTARTNTDR
jgi:hypothetical protein